MKANAIVGIAGDVANLYVVWWCSRFKQCLATGNIRLAMDSGYVDNINLVKCNTHIDTLLNEEQMNDNFTTAQLTLAVAV